jgi:hypothetical protein
MIKPRANPAAHTKHQATNPKPIKSLVLAAGPLRGAIRALPAAGPPAATGRESRRRAAGGSLRKEPNGRAAESETAGLLPDFLPGSWSPAAIVSVPSQRTRMHERPGVVTTAHRDNRGCVLRPIARVVPAGMPPRTHEGQPKAETAGPLITASE